MINSVKNNWPRIQIPLQIPVSPPYPVNPDAPKDQEWREEDDDEKESPGVVVIDI